MIRVKQNFRQAGLPPADVAMLEYAELITVDPARVSRANVEIVRRHGFSDEEILDIALLAAYRNFVGRVADSLGVELDERFANMPAHLRATLMGGKQL